MSVNHSNSAPTLKSLIDCVDELMKSPPIESSRCPVLAAFFDEAAMVKCAFLVYYPSSARVNFHMDFESFLAGQIVQWGFTEQWASIFHIESSHLRIAASGPYSLSGDQITNGLEVLPVIRYQIDDDIQMSLAPFSPVLGASKSVPGSSKSPGGSSTTVTLQDNAFAPSPDPAPFIELFAEKQGTLQDAIEIGNKITDMYRRSFNKLGLCCDEDFCAFCSGTPSHPIHECPARSAKAIHACTPCVKAGTKCIFAGLATECIACHKGILQNCMGGIPNHQILWMPFDDLHPEEDEHVLSLIEDMIDFDPFGIKTPEGFPQDQHTKGIINNAKAYVGANAQQFLFHSVKSIAVLVKVQDSYYNHLQANTHELYLLLKVCHIIVQHVHFVMAKLNNLHEEEDTEANTAAKTASASQPTLSSSHHVPWWRVRKECQAR
ncbi:hypothetical protein IW261DRAFT_1570967 [Armillaria novae-zelandiae]|uniref:Uncharacterized protein n=1 Tax=Armillaria novae-zelandiae TaxID=153914 RepID=A0AA39U1M6_9AGAR|nr:hypothetical protein IW261DRAFT_1570967 [Armillaria novae-zelandiae]